MIVVAYGRATNQSRERFSYQRGLIWQADRRMMVGKGSLSNQTPPTPIQTEEALVKRLFLFIVGSLALLFLTACGGRPGAAADMQNAIDIAVAATVTAQANMQAAIDAAVAATATAQATSVTPASTPAATPTPTPAPLATPTPSVEYVTMTEEELAALIDEAVNEAVAASQEAANAADEAADDGDVSSDEAQTIEVYIQLSEETIAYAEELIDAYQEQYGETADEFLAVLTAMEEDLAQLADNTAAIAESLDEINSALEQGLALAEESVAQLEAAAAQANATAEQIQQQAQVWQTAVLSQLQQRDAVQGQASTAGQDILSQFQPTEVAGDSAAALRSAWTYVNMAQKALADAAISPDELNAIAQAGVNASAGLKTHGGPQLQNAAAQIDAITRQLAQGQIAQAQHSLQQLQAGLPALPPASGNPNRSITPGRGGRDK